MIYPPRPFLLIASGVAASILYWFFVQTGIKRSAHARKSTWQWQHGLLARFFCAASFSLTDVYGTEREFQRIDSVADCYHGRQQCLLLIVAQGFAKWSMHSAALAHWLSYLRIIPGFVFLALHDMGLLRRMCAAKPVMGDIPFGGTVPVCPQVRAR